MLTNTEFSAIYDCPLELSPEIEEMCLFTIAFPAISKFTKKPIIDELWSIKPRRKKWKRPETEKRLRLANIQRYRQLEDCIVSGYAKPILDKVG
jgi:hypothetical protein